MGRLARALGTPLPSNARRKHSHHLGNDSGEAPETRSQNLPNLAVNLPHHCRGITRNYFSLVLFCFGLFWETRYRWPENTLASLLSALMPRDVTQI